jgi:hypothetical protein
MPDEPANQAETEELVSGESIETEFIHKTLSLNKDIDIGVVSPGNSVSADSEETSSSVSADMEEFKRRETVAEKLRGLANEVGAYIGQFVRMSPEQVDASVLWVIHTHAIDAAQLTPYLHITSAQRESGKSTTLDILKSLAANALRTSHMSPAMLRRAFEKPATLFWDEIDRALAAAEKRTEGGELIAALNDGYKRGATVPVLVQPKGKDWQPKEFNVFAPKCFAGIGPLGIDSIASRCIPIELVRALPAEAQNLRRFEEDREAAETKRLRERLEAVAKTAVRHLLAADPEAPNQLSGRQAGIWRPLLAIADFMGESWPMRARRAAVKLHSGRANDSQEVTLLRDIRDYFTAHQGAGVTSQDLSEWLLDVETSPWASWLKFGPYQISQMLNLFDIRPEKLPREICPEQHRGYRKDQFADAWTRYL